METILSISGRPGLYKLVSKGKGKLIVEALDSTHRRLPAFPTDRVVSLADIAIYTDGDDMPLYKVLESIKQKEQAKPAGIALKSATNDALRDYFAAVLPNYDRERVHVSDMKKVIQWYNILVGAGCTDFEKNMAPTKGDNVDDRANEKEE